MSSTDDEMIRVFHSWFMRNLNIRNSMFTTEILTFKEGSSQMKWWKQAGTIIIKEIELKEEFRGKTLITDAAQEMLKWSEVKRVTLESVSNMKIIEKYLNEGWKQEFQFIPTNLVYEQGELVIF